MVLRAQRFRLNACRLFPGPDAKVLEATAFARRDDTH